AQGPQFSRYDDARRPGSSRRAGPHRASRWKRHRQRAIPAARFAPARGRTDSCPVQEMNLDELLSGVTLRQPIPPQLAQSPVDGLDYASRRVQPGYLFFAFPGSHADGRQFARDAIARGALAVASESEPPPELAARWVQVEHGRQALSLAARQFYGQPDEQIG